MTQFWSIVLVSLLAYVNGGPLKDSGDCGSRINLTKSNGGGDPAIVSALTNECTVEWNADVSKLIECLQMAVAVNNLIKETADEATRLQLIVTQISAYKYVEVIQNGAIGGWGTIQQFIECQGLTWIEADCRARYDLLKPHNIPFFPSGIFSACSSLISNTEENTACVDMGFRVEKHIRDTPYAYYAVKGIVNELNAYKKISERNANFIKTAVIGGWGTLQQFIDCPGPTLDGSGGLMFINISMPSSWTYPPKGYPAGRGQQTKEWAEANMKTAMNKVKAAMEDVDESIVIDQASAFFIRGIEVLDFEKKSSIDYASFGGTVVTINNEGKIVGACVKRVPNKCTTESEFMFGRDDHPKASANFLVVAVDAIQNKMKNAFVTTLKEQGLLLLGQTKIQYGE